MEVIFLHGLGQGPSSWDSTMKALDKQVKAVCLDLFALVKGGIVDYPALYHSFSKECSRKKEGKGLHLCGLSLGAVLALQYAQEHPESVKSLVLIGGRVRTPKALLKVQNALFHLMGEKNFREMGLSKTDAIALMSTMGELDLRGGLGRVTCPTLVLCGEKDSANRKDARAMSVGIPEAGFATVPGAGHEVNREAPEALVEILNQFYGTLQRKRNFSK